MSIVVHILKTLFFDGLTTSTQNSTILMSHRHAVFQVSPMISDVSNLSIQKHLQSCWDLVR